MNIEDKSGWEGSGDKQQNVYGNDAKIKLVLKKLSNVIPIKNKEYVPKQKKKKDKQSETAWAIIPDLPTKELRNIKKKRTEKEAHELPALNKKLTIKLIRETKEEKSQVALRSQPSTAKTSKSKKSKSTEWTPKASTSQECTSKASTSKEWTPKASTSSEASQSKASKSKSSTPIESENPSSSTSTATGSNAEFWTEVIRTNFKSSEYKKYLINCEFSEGQANVLQKYFHQASCTLSHLQTRDYSIIKTHKCQDCVFSIKHLCYCLPTYQKYASAVDTSLFEPEKTNMCPCSFSFFHTHSTNSSCSETAITAGSLPNPHSMRNCVANLICDPCKTSFKIKQLIEKHPSGALRYWSIGSDIKKRFYDEITDKLKNFDRGRITDNDEVSYGELFTCECGCCIIFHRCPIPSYPKIILREMTFNNDS